MREATLRTHPWSAALVGEAAGPPPPRSPPLGSTRGRLVGRRRTGDHRRPPPRRLTSYSGAKAPVGPEATVASGPTSGSDSAGHPSVGEMHAQRLNSCRLCGYGSRLEAPGWQSHDGRVAATTPSRAASRPPGPKGLSSSRGVTAAGQSGGASPSVGADTGIATSSLQRASHFDGEPRGPRCQPLVSWRFSSKRSTPSRLPRSDGADRSGSYQAPRTRSNAAPSAITGPSWPAGPTNCTPMGNPDTERPPGIDIAGKPTKLHGIALRESTIR